MVVLCQGLKGKIDGWMNGDTPATGHDNDDGDDDGDDGDNDEDDDDEDDDDEDDGDNCLVKISEGRDGDSRLTRMNYV